jgi:long-chain acyl-CoA synthetase
VVSGYFRDEENTKERFLDGWFNTGDVVRIDRDGYVTIVDRATDIIIVSGFNVYPQEVENLLCQHHAVQAAAAVGEKNNLAGEIVKAFVILKEGKEASEKELIDYCKKNLAHYKVPRRIGFLKEFPISAAGKILRRELRKMDTER